MTRTDESLCAFIKKGEVHFCPFTHVAGCPKQQPIFFSNLHVFSEQESGLITTNGCMHQYLMRLNFVIGLWELLFHSLFIIFFPQYPEN